MPGESETGHERWDTRWKKGHLGGFQAEGTACARARRLVGTWQVGMAEERLGAAGAVLRGPALWTVPWLPDFAPKRQKSLEDFILELLWAHVCSSEIYSVLLSIWEKDQREERMETGNLSSGNSLNQPNLSIWFAHLFYFQSENASDTIFICSDSLADEDGPGLTDETYAEIR